MIPNEIYLGVNIDHIATIRQARGTIYPDPILAALLAEQAGADGITLHLREDRRHIQDRDVFAFKDRLQTRMNLEMATSEDIIKIAERVKPEYCCLVPERREELTTEGGLDVAGHFNNVSDACKRLMNAGSEISLFIDPDFKQIDAAVKCEVSTIEIHTGSYADAHNEKERQRELEIIQKAARYAKKAGLIVNAGHGLHYHNVQAIAAIPEINELNIGHAIIARALFSGISEAVREMKRLMVEVR